MDRIDPRSASKDTALLPRRMMKTHMHSKEIIGKDFIENVNVADTYITMVIGETFVEQIVGNTGGVRTLAAAVVTAPKGVRPALAMALSSTRQKAGKWYKHAGRKRAHRQLRQPRVVQPDGPLRFVQVDQH